mgnify:CR=1 FL=1
MRKRALFKCPFFLYLILFDCKTILICNFLCNLPVYKKFETRYNAIVKTIKYPLKRTKSKVMAVAVRDF